jgi:nitroreductase
LKPTPPLITPTAFSPPSALTGFRWPRLPWGMLAAIGTVALTFGVMAYLLLARRYVGLDCGPKSGFNNAAVDAAFFPDSSLRSNFLMNIGYGDPTKLFPRLPRPEFSDFCKVV